MESHVSCSSIRPVNLDADDLLASDPANGCCDLPLEPLDQLTVGSDEGPL